jgi:hypothetical protein
MHWILLHDTKMFGAHLTSMAGQLLISWLLLDWPLYWAVFTSFRKLPAILRKRRENRRAAVRTDRELQKLLDSFYRTAPIVRRNF